MLFAITAALSTPAPSKMFSVVLCFFFFFQAEDGIRDPLVTGVQTCALPIFDWEPIKVGAFWSAAITFTMFEAAYYCEIMRAGIQSIPRGQVWSGYALGLDRSEERRVGKECRCRGSQCDSNKQRAEWRRIETE